MAFRIKVCGLTQVDDIEALLGTPIDAVGFNFYSKSRRHTSAANATKLAAMLPTSVKRVGLFVNATLAEIAEITQSVALDVVQLHGDEPAELAAKVDANVVIRAFRFGKEGIGPIVEYVAKCAKLGRPLDAVLVDAAEPGEFGGTGKTLDWNHLASERSQLGDVPMILAGGLHDENVAQAIALVAPFGVDTASGVEDGIPGQKSKDRMIRFANEANKALQQLNL